MGIGSDSFVIIWWNFCTKRKFSLLTDEAFTCNTLRQLIDLINFELAIAERGSLNAQCYFLVEFLFPNNLLQILCHEIISTHNKTFIVSIKWKSFSFFYELKQNLYQRHLRMIWETVFLLRFSTMINYDSNENHMWNFDSHDTATVCLRKVFLSLVFHISFANRSSNSSIVRRLSDASRDDKKICRSDDNCNRGRKKSEIFNRFFS